MTHAADWTKDTRSDGEIDSNIAQMEARLARIGRLARERALHARLACVPDEDFIGLIQEQAATLFGVPEEVLVGASRKEPHKDARFAAMWAIRKVRPGISFPRLAKAFSKKDHCTVMHACQVVDDRLTSNDISYASFNRMALTLLGMAQDIQQAVNRQSNNFCSDLA